MRVLLTGGGTAGHINPALAIAETVQRNAPGSEVAFVGIRGGKEEDLVPREGYELYYVSSRGIRRSLSPRALLSNAHALWLAAFSPYYPSTCAILDRFQPDIVIGTGGYACWPIMAAAARRGIPTAVHESNALPGLAVRRLQGRVDRIWTNFDQTAALLRPTDRLRRVGNPLRGGFGGVTREEARRRLGMREGERLVLCFGGSLGAEAVNRAVLRMMQVLAPTSPDVQFLLSSGKRDGAACRALFAEYGLDRYPNCTLTDYIYDMPICMAAAELAVARAGAVTLSELGRLGLPSVLIPSPNVADDHQYHNAKALADAGAAVLIREEELPSGRLQEAVGDLLADTAGLATMGRASAALSDTDADRLIWEDIVALVGEQTIMKK